MIYKYGSFTQSQIAQTKEKMRKQIFFLLLIVDPKTSIEYENVDVKKAFENVLRTFGGLNELLNYPQELVKIMSLLEAARLEYLSEDFKFQTYRKIILDAGNEVLNIKEVDENAEP